MPENRNRLNATVSRWSPRQLARRALLGCIPRNRLLERLPGAGAVYLTFDDGPHPEYTPQLLDTLAAHGLPATFFVLGDKCAKYPEIVRRIVSEGHAVGSHSCSHLDARSTATRKYLADIKQCDDELSKIIGVCSPLYRPPFGRLSLGAFLSLVRRGRTIVLWSVDVRDYESTPTEIESFLTANALRDGDILLMQDAHPNAAVMLPFVSRQVAERGLTCRTLPTAVRRPYQSKAAVSTK